MHLRTREEAREVIDPLLWVFDLFSKLFGSVVTGRKTVFQFLEPRFFHVLVNLRLTDVLAFFDVVDI